MLLHITGSHAREIAFVRPVLPVSIHIEATMGHMSMTEQHPLILARIVYSLVY